MALEEIFSTLQRMLYFPLFQIGQTHVTLMSLLLFAVVLVGFIVLSRILSQLIDVRIMARTQIEEGTRYTLRRMIQYTLILLGAIVAVQFVGIDLSGLAVIFGLLSVGIGFGLQNLTSNFISGLILLFERPVKVGDRITVGDTEGDVLAINIRSTTVRSLDNISIIVPNSELVSTTVINWSHGDPKIRLVIDVGVSYNSDLDTVLRSLKEVADENPEVLRHPEPEVHLTGFGDSAWNMRLRVWIASPKRYHYVRSAINCAIVQKFRENNVEIPFPQRDLHVRSPLPMPLLREDRMAGQRGAAS